MEGKSVAVTLLFLGLVLGQIQVEGKSCCASTTSRNIYNTCRFAGGSQSKCASLSGCKHVTETNCPSAYPRSTLENTVDAVNEYCNLGCTFSLCGSIITLQNSGEIVNEAVETCNNACATVCAKSSIAAVETA